MNRWSVHVKNFGKIEEADVEIAPLTLFVGDNNSGKSYMMTLIYGLLNIRFFFDGYIFDEESQIFRQCCKIIDRMLPTEQQICEYTLSDEEISQLQQLMNQVLQKNKQKLLLSLFNRKMTIGELWVEFPKHMKVAFELTDVMEGERNQSVISIHQKIAHNSRLPGYQESRDKMKDGALGYRFFLSYVMESMLHGKMGIPQVTKRVYLPTTRTGFLLTYKTLIGSAVQEKFTMEETGKNLLTKPNSDFLKELGGMNTTEERKRFQELVEFIEKHLISGHVSVSDTPAHDLAYTPEGSKQKLPLYVTSGVVTELTPLLLFLKHVYIGTLFFEEPEISLHPQLQWQVARVLIRLTNMGLPVYVTTHSDIILQHINNMIKANEMNDRNAFLEHSDYEEQDLLSRDDVRVYQFEVQGNQKARVFKLPCGDYGFEAMTFYDTLQKLNEEIRRIENEA